MKFKVEKHEVFACASAHSSATSFLDGAQIDFLRVLLVANPVQGPFVRDIGGEHKNQVMVVENLVYIARETTLID